MQEELGLNMYDYGARNYDPSLGRWMNIDPLAEKALDRTLYHYCSNNPINRIDPDGRTDYTLNRRTGEVKQFGEANDEPDRILKTNGKGTKIRKDKNGNAKVAVDNIAKGILKNGQNFKKDDTVIDVNSEGQPNLNDVEEFILKLSEYVGKEITGMYLSNENRNDAKISKVYIGDYQYSTSTSCDLTADKYYKESDLRKMFPITAFHTHPSAGHSRENVENPSEKDIKHKNKIEGQFYKHIILYRSNIKPFGVATREYTNDK